MRGNKRMAVDAAMVALLPMLMAYDLIGERFHEVAGLLMCALFVAHHVLNRKWFASLGKGAWTPRRVLQTVLDGFLLVWMVAQPVSGVLVSRSLFTFLPPSGAASAAREVHLALAYWGFVVLSVHAGTHLAPMAAKVRRFSRPVRTGCRTALLAVCAYGAFAFVRRGMPGYLFRRSLFAFFDYREPLVWFLLDYLAVMVLWATVGYLLAAAAAAQGRRNSGRAVPR